MSRVIHLCLSLAILLTFVPVSVQARPVIKSILPEGAPNPQNRTILVKTNAFTLVGVWINRRSDCETLAVGPDFGGTPNTPPNFYTSPLTMLSAYEGSDSTVGKGDQVCVGPRKFFQTPTKGVARRCSCRRVR